MCGGVQSSLRFASLCLCVCVMRVTLFVCYVFLFLVLSLRRFELFFALRFGIETVVVEVLVVCAVLFGLLSPLSSLSFLIVAKR